MGGHAKLFTVGRAVWGEARPERHCRRVWDGGGMRGSRKGIIRLRVVREEGVLGGRPGSGVGNGGGKDVRGDEVGEVRHFI